MDAEMFDRVTNSGRFAQFKNYIEKSAFIEAVRNTNVSVFDTYAWDRREENMSL